MAYAKGTCSVCGRSVSVAKNGKPVGTHKRVIEHSSPTPEQAAQGAHREVVEVECRGSRREVKEHAGRHKREVLERAAERRAMAKKKRPARPEAATPRDAPAQTSRGTRRRPDTSNAEN